MKILRGDSAMKVKYLLLILAFLMILLITGIAQATSTDDNQGSATGGNITMQDDSGDDESGDNGDDEADEGDDESGDEEPADDEAGDDEEPSDEEPSEEEPTDEEPSDEEPSDEEPSDEEPSEEEPAEIPGAGLLPGNLGDFAAGMPGLPGAGVDTILQNALDGYADYEVSYDTSISHGENTPDVLSELGVQYSEKDDVSSEAGQRALALEGFNLINILEDRYQRVEDKYAADPDFDFAPEDSERTLNYFEPRFDPFIITELIPDELRTEMEGTGLDGTVDPELLRLLGEAIIEANLRIIPITVVGVIQIGTRKACMYSLWGSASQTIWEGETHWWGFTITCNQVSENFVVFTLRSGGAMVVRTFHITSY